MTKKVRKFIGEQNAFVSWTVDGDFEQMFIISDGDKRVQFTEWGRDKKSLSKHDKEIGMLIDELIAYRNAIKAKYEEKK